MKIYVSIQRGVNSSFVELDVSESITAKEVLELPEVKKLNRQEINLLKVGINGEELDGKYKAKPLNYRMSHGERLEVYKPLFQDPKERRKNKAKIAKNS
ncbi:RnfH family protein [Gammaproteobacteria bacterium]|jgi:putative ubiquitin-RnfH superfamily antitoxin RatB of RatAB toxin-antitoxin module|nr:RnfH family protein [Gammaproteobacteria bacterium]MDB2611382.1 RnfH family protein [Gammaproteobacteria bacterium]